MTVAALEPALLADPEFHATGEPHAVWRWMREHAPVHWHPEAELPGFWSVTRHADVRAVYGEPGVFSSAHGVLLRRVDRGADPGGGLTLALTDPPRHRRMRALIAGHFSMRAALASEEVIRADVRETLDDALEQEAVDFAQDVAARLSIALICRLLGIPHSDFLMVYRWTHEAYDAQVPLTMHLPIMRYFIDLMEARLAVAENDAASMLAHGDVDGERLSETELLLNFENLVGATENAGLSMATGMQAFLEHPAEWRRLKEDRALLPTAVEEVLRWASSATHSMRTATQAFVLGSQPIGVGDRVVLWLPSANRDESAFARPETFDIGRRPNRHLALGFGEHVCIGGSMARVQLRILLSELVDTVAEIEQAGAVVPLRSVAVNGPAHLPVRMSAM
jgi:cytochrome P450